MLNLTEGEVFTERSYQKHKLTIRRSFSNKFSSNVHIWTKHLTSALKTTNQLSIHLREWLLFLMKQPHVNKNIKKPKFQKLLSSSTCGMFLYLFRGQSTISNLFSFWWLDWFKIHLKFRKRAWEIEDRQ